MTDNRTITTTKSTIICTGCNRAIFIPKNQKQFRCSYCGAVYYVQETDSYTRGTCVEGAGMTDAERKRKEEDNVK